MNLTDYFHIADNKITTIEFLRDYGLIHSHMSCPTCGSEMYTDFEAGLFRCQLTSYKINAHRKRIKVKCNSKLSIYVDSWFSQNRIKIEEYFRLIVLYIYHDTYTQERIAHECRVDIRTVRYCENRINKVLSRWERDNGRTKLGGRGIKVEVDEMKFGGKRLPRGRPVNGETVFGLHEVLTRRLITVRVRDRSGAALLPRIQKHVKVGTTVITDCWKGYKGLTALGYNHQRVNHRYNHVNQNTGAHIQHIERDWRELRRQTPKYGVRPWNIQDKLSKFVLNYTFHYTERVDKFFRILGGYYSTNPRI